ncbi:cytochrome P450 [Micromonospora sp. WMMD718]|uniref:cytochrome P450 n=1 Tax=unclassified Micromonospora TaxID=2617518 RepID=UPI00069F3B25|nr:MULTISPECIES: cytochrome P450 [unclassified Micromonospora]MDG4752668.1 cytochrome P450 [Micromonospora sp. WMMD718]
MTTSETTIPPQPNVNDAAIYPWYRMMRDEHPVRRDPVTGWWVVYRYDDARHVLTNPQIFSSEMHRMGYPESGLESLPQMDPPRHTRVRRILGTTFTPHSIAEFEPLIVRITNEVIDGFVDKDRIDFVAELAYTVPIAVILEVLGLPSEDRVHFYDWARRVMDVTPEQMAQEGYAESLFDMQQDAVNYLREKVRERRGKAGEDMLTRLANAQLDGDTLTDDETANFANVMFAGGHISTTMTIANTIDLLDMNGQAQRDVRDNPSLLPQAIEEVLRHRPPITTGLRGSTRDVELGGVTIPKHQYVAASFCSANRDERQFTDPDAFDIHRAGEVRHFGFGFGTHHCIGNALGRLETRLVVRTLHERFKEITVDRDGEVAWAKPPQMVGYDRLPVVLQPA